MSHHLPPLTLLLAIHCGLFRNTHHGVSQPTFCTAVSGANLQNGNSWMLWSRFIENGTFSKEKKHLLVEVSTMPSHLFSCFFCWLWSCCQKKPLFSDDHSQKSDNARHEQNAPKRTSHKKLEVFVAKGCLFLHPPKLAKAFWLNHWLRPFQKLYFSVARPNYEYLSISECLPDMSKKTYF